MTQDKHFVPVVTLDFVNTFKPRRPIGARIAGYDDPLTSPEMAVDFFVELRHPALVWNSGSRLGITETVLADLRLLREAVDEALRSFSHRGTRRSRSASVPHHALITLNQMSSRCSWAKRLSSDFTLTDVANTSDLVGLVASLCVQELSECDPTRIKICERYDCELFFYDRTRNRNARWHAENPCGWRDRADRY